jgi:hypothetical protein
VCAERTISAVSAPDAGSSTDSGLAVWLPAQLRHFTDPLWPLTRPGEDPGAGTA